MWRQIIWYMCVNELHVKHILPAISKVFERAISEQLEQYFVDFFNPYLSAFRSGYICQAILLALTEE